MALNKMRLCLFSVLFFSLIHCMARVANSETSVLIEKNGTYECDSTVLSSERCVIIATSFFSKSELKNDCLMVDANSLNRGHGFQICDSTPFGTSGYFIEWPLDDGDTQKRFFFYMFGEAFGLEQNYSNLIDSPLFGRMISEIELQNRTFPIQTNKILEALFGEEQIAKITFYKLVNP